MEAVSTPQSTTPTDVDIVKTLIAALEQFDLEKAFSLCAPTIRWQNVPFPPTKNKRQFEQQVRWMWSRAQRFEVEMKEIKAYDGIVFTDRIDIVEAGGFCLRLPVEGTFKVEQGLITEWTDRFPYPPIAAAFVKSLPAMVRYRLRRK